MFRHIITDAFNPEIISCVMSELQTLLLTMEKLKQKISRRKMSSFIRMKDVFIQQKNSKRMQKKSALLLVNPGTFRCFFKKRSFLFTKDRKSIQYNLANSKKSLVILISVPFSGFISVNHGFSILKFYWYLCRIYP